MNRNGMVMLGWLVAAGLLMGQAPTAAAQASVVCPVDGARSGTATIPRSAVGQAATLGGVGHDDAREIKEAAWFSTVCPVIIDKVENRHDHCFEGVDPLDLTNTQMRIERVADATFRMWLLNFVSGAVVAFVPNMAAYQAGAAPDFAEKAEPPFEYLRGEGADGNMYFVYFRDGESGRDLMKNYKIEVYYKGPNTYLCEDHMPNRPRKDEAEPADKEGGVGEGRERPPGNP